MPVSVRGPGLFFALARFAVICAGDAMRFSFREVKAGRGIHISDLVVAHVFPRWENILNDHSHIYAAQQASKLYYAARAFNGYIEERWTRRFIFAYVFPYAAGYTGILSSKLPMIFNVVTNILFPKAYLLSFFSFSLSEGSVRFTLSTFKIFSGTEYKTEEAIRAIFKDKPECEKGLKAHALWMRLMRKGRPEELFMQGWFRVFAPSAA